MSDLKSVVLNALPTQSGRESLIDIYLIKYFISKNNYDYYSANQSFKDGLIDIGVPEELIFDIPEYSYKITKYMHEHPIN